MPEICRFYGIIIAMYYNDHAPPHFHARYGKHRAIISIEGLMLLEGDLPPQALENGAGMGVRQTQGTGGGLGVGQKYDAIETDIPSGIAANGALIC